MSQERSHGERDRDPTRVADYEAAHYRFDPERFGWEGVERKAYAEPVAGRDFARIDRQVIIGHHSGRPSMHLRYFELAPGGYSCLEKHRHEHLVIGARGAGQVIVGREVRELRERDALYIGPDTPHQFVNPGPAPFGFFCVVPAERDRPRDLSAEELAAIERDPVARAVLRRGPAESI
ncbi:MAG TPA: cupin domain-containing protein [Thermodesulfobacteriota bacterium]|nr:cupin domain-containing protein [Thermodesulfobacteriota bacterium]